jgi:dipeptidyl aminopeptidase/acylaminoacyl peptidase
MASLLKLLKFESNNSRKPSVTYPFSPTRSQCRVASIYRTNDAVSEWEFKGTPWQRPELYDKFSPSRYVAQWQTPMLVIHGANDFRLVDAEGIATFTALQRRGIPSQFLYFPDENHWVQKPKNSIVWHDSILAWLDKWLRKN